MSAMAEIFVKVPLLAWAIILGIAFGALWKVFNVLHVKPRDFRIQSLEKENESLKSEQRQPEFGEVPESEMAAKQSQKKFPIKSLEPDTPVIERPIDSPPARKPDDEISLAEGLRSLAFALSRLKDKNLTGLQKEAVEEYFTGKSVVWTGTIQEVSNAPNGSISVHIADGDRLFNTAVA